MTLAHRGLPDMIIHLLLMKINGYDCHLGFESR